MHIHCWENATKKGSLALLWFSGLSAVRDFALECSVCERRPNVRKGGLKRVWVGGVGFGSHSGQQRYCVLGTAVFFFC